VRAGGGHCIPPIKHQGGGTEPSKTPTKKGQGELVLDRSVAQKKPTPPPPRTGGKAEKSK